MFFQEAPPDTSGYMAAGYIVAFVVMSLYIFRLYIRNRNLHQDMAMLEELEKPVAAVKPKPGKPAKKAVTKKGKKK